MADVPESLQSCCFAKLFNDFETFPPESLALLPLRLRYDLIQNLPIVDVCRLEQTSFVTGLDMEKVWSTIAKKCGLGKAPNQSKDHFFSEVCTAILNGHEGPSVDQDYKPSEVLVRLLFSGHVVLAHFKSSLPHRLPLRHKQYSGLSLSNPAECIKIVLEKTQYHPGALAIDAYDLYYRFLSTENSPWLEGGNDHLLLADYLSEVSYLDIDGYVFKDHGKGEEAIRFIMQVIGSQTSLCRLQVTIDRRFTSPEVSHLFTDIATGLLRQPQFCEMDLRVSMHSSCFQEIIQSFIASPCSNDCCLSLGGHITEDTNPIDHSCLSPPQENILHKTLILSVHLPDTVLQWMHEHIVLRLKELQLRGLQYAWSHSHLLNHPRMEFEKLSLSFSEYSELNFNHLLQNTHLKRLSVDLVEKASLLGLVHGLCKQTQLGTLEMLRVRYLSDQFFPAEATALFTVIISLPQLENFTLDICFFHTKDYKPHADVLYQVWKEKAGGKRLKRLVLTYSSRLISRPFISPDLSFLQNVTRDFDYCLGYKLTH